MYLLFVFCVEIHGCQYNDNIYQINHTFTSVSNYLRLDLCATCNRFYFLWQFLLFLLGMYLNNQIMFTTVLPERLHVLWTKCMQRTKRSRWTMRETTENSWLGRNDPQEKQVQFIYAWHQIWKLCEIYFWMKIFHSCVGLSVCNTCTSFMYRRGFIIVQLFRPWRKHNGPQNLIRVLHCLVNSNSYVRIRVKFGIFRINVWISPHYNEMLIKNYI